MSLYHKYRPKSFEEIVGNESVVLSLQEELEKGDRAHSFLFHGNSGCGKTTLGRIIASELECFGRDLNEIDSAQMRGIDTIREIRKMCMYSPFESKSIVFMIDECHKITSDGQSALLKLLEDTPEHVYFILCTTDPQKLLPTIRSRCLQYEVSTLSESEMRGLLKEVRKAEGIKLAKGVTDQIINDCEGSPRNALQILDQVMNIPLNKQLVMAKRSAELQSKTIELCRALLNPHCKWTETSRILQGLKEENIERMRWAIMVYCNTAMLRGNHLAATIINQFEEPFFNSGFNGFCLACYYIKNQE